MPWDLIQAYFYEKPRLKTLKRKTKNFTQNKLCILAVRNWVSWSGMQYLALFWCSFQWCSQKPPAPTRFLSITISSVNVRAAPGRRSFCRFRKVGAKFFPSITFLAATICYFVFCWIFFFSTNGLSGFCLCFIVNGTKLKNLRGSSRCKKYRGSSRFLIMLKM